MPTTVVHDLRPRIEAAAQALRDSEKIVTTDREVRRRLVHQAADAGVSMREIARWLGGGTGLVSKILGNPGPQE